MVTSSTNMVMGGAGKSAFELYPTLPRGNAVMAPMNLSAVLAMTYLGSRKATQQELGQHLTLSDPWARQLGKEAVRLSMNCGLFHKPEIEIAPAYLKELEEFKASARPLVHSEGMNPLNAWVAAATHKHVPDFFPDRALQDAKVVLVSTLAMRQTWEIPFQGTAETDPSKKARPDGMMHFQGTLAFAPHEAFQLLRVSCKGGGVQVCFMLPRERSGLNKIFEGLTYKKFTSWLGELKDNKVTVSLPRFQVGSKIELADGLRNIVQPRAFTAGQADFTGMSSAPELALSRVMNQTVVRVSEEGLEVLTAAAVVFAARPYVTERPAESHPDHPFQFFVRDKSSGGLLAMGRGEQHHD